MRYLIIFTALLSGCAAHQPTEREPFKVPADCCVNDRYPLDEAIQNAKWALDFSQCNLSLNTTNTALYDCMRKKGWNL